MSVPYRLKEKSTGTIGMIVYPSRAAAQSEARMYKQKYGWNCVAVPVPASVQAFWWKRKAEHENKLANEECEHGSMKWMRIHQNRYSEALSKRYRLLFDYLRARKARS